MTKTFTATLLASLAGEGVVKLDDDVDRWIPAAKGRGITLRKWILTPLGMTCSGTGDSGGGTRIPGYSKGKAHPCWAQPLPGAGGMEPTAHDIARCLKACLDPPDDALGAALALAQAPELRIDEHRQISLAWNIFDQGAFWHNGQTGGFTTSAVFDPTTGRALAVLVNTAVGQSQVLARNPRADRPGSASTVPAG